MNLSSSEVNQPEQTGGILQRKPSRMLIPTQMMRAGNPKSVYPFTIQQGWLGSNGYPFANVTIV